MRVRRPLVVAAVVAALGVGLGGGVAVASPTPPSEQDVRDAQRAVDSAAQSVADMELRLAQLSAQADAADLTVQQAGEAYTQAVVDADAAQDRAAEARQRADDAADSAEQARRALVTMAREMARSGGSVDALQSVLSADGFQDVARRSSTLERLTGKADDAVQEYRATQLVAGTLAGRADEAAAEAADARQDAEDALAAAEQANQDAQDALAAGAAEREHLIAQLAAARQTSADVERQRQDQLEAQRRERENAAAQAAALEQSAPPAGTGSSGGGSAGTGTAGSGTSGTGTAGSGTSGTGASGSGTSGAGTAGSGSGSSGGGSTGSGDAAPPADGGSQPADDTPPAADPPPPSTPPVTTPPVTTPPVTTPPAPPSSGLGSGVSRGSAAAGQAAVEWAKARVGLPYLWAGAGPDAFDCSGLTMRAWQAAGVNLNRTSRDQYKQVLKIPYSQLRPGDLVFWSSDPTNPNAIYHVAMWAGNGQIVEAPKPGAFVRVVPMRWAGTMPYAGRP